MKPEEEAARRKKIPHPAVDGTHVSGARRKITAGSRWQSLRSARSHFADIGGEDGGYVPVFRYPVTDGRVNSSCWSAFTGRQLAVWMRKPAL